MSEQHLKAMRESPEYQAAFDLELWKKDQVAKMKQVLEDEKVKIRQQLEDEYIVRDEERMDELDTLRTELESMAVGLKKSGSALHTRILGLEKSENAIEAKRLANAREHESVLLAADSRVRQVRDEMSLQTELLETRLREKDKTIHRIEERCHKSDIELSSLRNMMGKARSGEDELRVEISLVTERLAITTQQLEASKAAEAATAKEKEEVRADCTELREACQHYKKQLKSLAAQHNELLKQISKERSKTIAEERQRLSTESSKLEAQQSALSAQLKQQEEKPPARQQGGPGSNQQHQSSDITALKGLIENLVSTSERADVEYKQKVKAEEKKRKKDQRLRREQRAQRGMEYVPLSDPGLADPHGSRGGAGGPPPVVYQSTVQAIPVQDYREQREDHSHRQQNTGEHRPEEHAHGEETEAVSVSSLSEGGNPRDEVEYHDSEHQEEQYHVDPSDHATPIDAASSHQSAQDQQQQQQQQQVSVPTASLIARGAIYPSVTGDEASPSDGSGGYSPTHDQAAYYSGITTGAVSSSPVGRQQQLQYEESTGGRSTGSLTTGGAAVTSSGSNATATHEVTNTSGGGQSPSQPLTGDESGSFEFIKRLKGNRARLLETGVYTERDDFIVEMSRRIATYEGFIQQGQRDDQVI